LALVAAVSITGSTAFGDDGGTGNAVESLTTPKAVLLGVVEGVTEYLPVSSTGHLLITERLIDVGQSESDRAATDTYTVVIQIGAILAVLGIFRDRFVLMFQGMVGRSAEGRSLLVALLLAFVPAVVIAVVFQDPIKEKLLRPWPVVIAWTVGGAVILGFVARQSRLRERISTLGAVPPGVALGIGAAQAVALWPGTSRSFVTILAALWLGCSMTVAVEFAFLLGFLTLSAATGYELLQNGTTLVDTFGILNPIVGVVVAGIAAFVSVKWMIAYLEKHPLTIFGWYRIGVGVLTGALLATGVI